MKIVQVHLRVARALRKMPTALRARTTAKEKEIHSSGVAHVNNFTIYYYIYTFYNNVKTSTTFQLLTNLTFAV